jgi:hypothetical protein
VLKSPIWAIAGKITQLHYLGNGFLRRVSVRWGKTDKEQIAARKRKVLKLLRADEDPFCGELSGGFAELLQ